MDSMSMMNDAKFTYGLMVLAAPVLQLDHTDQHCLCAVGAVTHVTHVKGFRD